MPFSLLKHKAVLPSLAGLLFLVGILSYRWLTPPVPVGTSTSLQKTTSVEVDNKTARQKQTPKGDTNSTTTSHTPSSTKGVTSIDTIQELEGLASESIPAEVAKEIEHLDADLDGWRSEDFSKRTAEQLNQLGKLLTASEKPNSLGFTPFVDPAFVCWHLRPTILAKSYEYEEITVRRSVQEVATDSQEPIFTGPLGFEAAMNELLDKFSDTASVSAQFKVFRVKMMGDSPTTSVYVNFFANTSSGSIQQNSIWHCQWTNMGSSDKPLLVGLKVESLEEVLWQGKSKTFFVDNTAGVIGSNRSFTDQLQPSLEHWYDTLDWRLGIDLFGYHGVAVGDVNGDGLDDVYLCEPGGLPNRLFIQQPDGTARDESAGSGIDFLEPTQSALLIDIDNDGDQDLTITSGRFVLMYENDGTGHFSRRSTQRMTAIARSICAADYDLDGDLDVYVCGYFSREASPLNVGLGTPMPFHDANNGERNHLFENRGSWTFVDVTKEVGLDVNNQRFSLAASWEDFDNDGDPDLYVANDFGRNNLYRNDQGHFIDVAAEAGVEDLSAGMSVTWGDYNHDGLMDLYVSNMFSSAGNRIAYQREFKPGSDVATVGTYQRFARGNTLFENVGNGTFRDVTEESGATMGRWAWSSNFIDINNDSWQDLVVANGFITSYQDKDDL